MPESIDLAALDQIKLTITFDKPTGAVNLSGPINDKLFCYGLLELAKDCIKNFEAQQKQQILVAKPMIRKLGTS